MVLCRIRHIFYRYGGE